MSAKYDFFPNPPSDNNGNNKGKLHPRIVGGRTISIEDIAVSIAAGTTLSVADVIGVYTALKGAFVFHLREGDNLDLTDFVFISPIPKATRDVYSPDEIRAENIYLGGLSFIPAKAFMKELKTMTFQRAKRDRKNESYTSEERVHRILCYLKQGGEIRSSECQSLNNCSRYQAQKDLKNLYEAGKIIRRGGPRVAVYTLPDEK